MLVSIELAQKLKDIGYDKIMPFENGNLIVITEYLFDWFIEHDKVYFSVHHEEIGWWFDIYSFKDTCELEPCDMFLGESHSCDTYQEALIEAIEFYITNIRQ